MRVNTYNNDDIYITIISLLQRNIYINYKKVIVTYNKYEFFFFFFFFYFCNKKSVDFFR